MQTGVFMRIKQFLSRDCTRRTFWVTALVLVALKLFLASRQMVYITPLMAPIDDTLMYDTAVHITNGAWLGEYNWLTLSKYMLFPVWLAALHTLHIPYLLGGQILYAVACGVAVSAFAPIVRRNTARLMLLAFLLFNPMQTAAAVQLRVYRENITGALALLLFAGFAGAALRHRQSVRASLGYLLAGGIGLAGSFLNREDGAWYLVFCAAASVAVCVFILCNKGIPQKARKCAAQLIPYGVLGAAVLVFCTLNAVHYGRFILSDFTSVEFKDACGALMRVSDGVNKRDKVPVTKEALALLYEEIPEMRQIEKALTSHSIMNDFGAVDTGDYSAGAFYWALRRAVYESGLADNARAAQSYYTALAESVNAACDSGALPSEGGKRSTTLMAFRAEYLLPTAGETLANLGRALTFAECAPQFATISVCPPDLQAEYEAFLGNACNISAKPYTEDAYYLPKQERAFFVLEAIRVVYILCVPLLFAAALLWLALGAVRQVRSLRTKRPWPPRFLWWVMLGFLCSVLLRCGMIAYMFVTAFNAWVSRTPYLCGAQPALLLFCFIGALSLCKEIRAARRKNAWQA